MKKLKQNKLLKFIFGTIKALLTLAIILVVTVIVVQRIFNNNVSVGGYRIFTIITESMAPEYKVFDVIISKTTDAAKIKVGDDVVYKGTEGTFADKIITHRVIDIEKNDDTYNFTTQGIANTAPDPIINESQIYGVVVQKSVILSTISKLVNNSYGFYFLVLIPLAILVFSEVIDFVKPKTENNNDDE